MDSVLFGQPAASYGFTEQFVRECGHEVNECVIRALDVVSLRFDSLTPQSYESLKTKLKNIVRELRQYQDYLEKCHEDFVQEQQELALKLCGVVPFFNIAEFVGITMGLYTQFDRCSMQIANMQNFGEFSESDYSLNQNAFRSHLMIIRERYHGLVDAIIENHAPHTSLEFIAIRNKCEEMTSRFHLAIGEIEPLMPLMFQEVERVKRVLYSLRHRVLNRVSPLTLNAHNEIGGQINDLGIGNVYENVIQIEMTYQKDWSDIRDVITELYEVEVTMKSMWLKGIEDIRRIRPLWLSRDDEERVCLVLTGWTSLANKWRKLWHVEQHTLSRM